MLLSTQDDSLVFANETRYYENHQSEPDLANTSEIFGSPHANSEPTQVDLAEKTLDELEDTYTLDFAAPQTPKLPTLRLHEKTLSTSDNEKTEGLNDTLSGDTIPESKPVSNCTVIPSNAFCETLPALSVSGQENDLVTNQNAFSQNKDTQIINKNTGKSQSNILSTSNDINLAPTFINTQESLELNLHSNATNIDDINNLHDTQVIRPRIENEIYHPSPRGNPTQADDIISDTTMGADYNGPSDTQLIGGPHKRLTPDSIHFLNHLEAQISPQSSTIQPLRANVLYPDHVNKLSYPQLHDTQDFVRGTNPDMLDKASSFDDLSRLDETQKVHIKSTEQSSPITELKKQAVFSSPCKFDTSALHPTEFSDDGPNNAERDEKNVEEINEFDDTSIVESEYDIQNDRAEEATTQVLNTQEEVYNESSLKLVDLGNKPVYSSSQNDSKRSMSMSQLSVASEDEIENSEIEDVTFVYEDSIFNQKKQKSNDIGPKYENLGRASLELVILNSSLQLPSTEEVISSEPMAPATNQSIEGERNPLTQASKRGLAEEKNDPLSLTTSMEEEVLMKEDWSSASSELEDISRDASLSSLDMAFKESFTAEGLSQEVRNTSRRRNNAVPEVLTQSQEVLREEALVILSPECLVYGLAVWAFTLFRNFPAVALNVGEESSLVLSHNGKEGTVRNSDLHLLDIRIGDFVLVTLKFTPYVVTGLYCISESSQIKCVRGFDTVIISKKMKLNVGQGEELHVPLSEICMEADQWASHQQRFQFVDGDLDLLLAAYSVVNRVIVAQMKEKESQKAIMDMNAPLNKILIQSSNLKQGLFSGMFFFVTSIEGERKDHLQKLVVNNGGVLIDDEIDSILEKCTAQDGSCSLQLDSLKDYEFGALLSDGYSRSAKYLQALALGWPLLADVYVEKALEDPKMLDLWPSFLLPAGVSLHFKGTKSHDVFQFRKNFMNGLDMSEQLANNSTLLSSKTILILRHNQDKKVLQMCGFIFHAFGAKFIHDFESCSQIDSFIRAHGSESTLIYDNNNHEFQKSHEKKYKRKSQTIRHTVGVINWEWVVQCVISNLIWKPALEVQV